MELEVGDGINQLIGLHNQFSVKTVDVYMDIAQAAITWTDRYGWVLYIH